MKDPGSTIIWFRKCLRLHDNPALIEAVKVASETGTTLRCVYIFDPWYKENKRIAPPKYRFIIQSLHDLHESLSNLGSRLFVFKGDPRKIFKTYLGKWNTVHITWEKEIEPFSLNRDKDIQQLANDMNIEVTIQDSETLYETGYLIQQNGGTAPSNYKKFTALLKTVDPPARPAPTLSLLHDSCKISDQETILWECDIPSLRDLAGIDDEALEPSTFPGGETEGLKRLDEELFENDKRSNFLEPSHNELSPYVSLGCVSPRLIYWKLKDKYQDITSIPSLHFNLFYREFFYCIASVTPNFDKMAGNKLCRQIPWDDDIEKIRAWSNGKTGYPFIDAVMMQMKTEGWIHPQLRNVVACFLTRGDLWQSWEEGRSVFEEFLMDVDWCTNAAQWMRSSISAFAHQYFRVFSPIAYGQKIDPEGEYIRKYLPFLRRFPPEYIYEPWKSPLSVQKKASCFIGVDYPEPIVKHSVVYRENLKKMKQVFKENKENKENRQDQIPIVDSEESDEESEEESDEESEEESDCF